MSDHGGIRTQRRRVLFVLIALLIPLAGCEYDGPAEAPVQSSPQATPPPRTLGQNITEVARLLDASPTDPGMPSEAEPAGKLSTVLAPGDYTVTGACAGVYGAKLTIVGGDGGFPGVTDFTCDATLVRFLRHTGGPITISAVPANGNPAAAGLTLGPNTDPQASVLADMSEWASQRMPELPGELRGYTASDSPTGFGTSAEPGTYELHFLCEGPPKAGLSVSTWAGAEVLAPLQVDCNGGTFKATVELGTEGADFKMDPGSGPDARYVFRLVPVP
jgi:hypothetical protein